MKSEGNERRAVTSVEMKRRGLRSGGWVVQENEEMRGKGKGERGRGVQEV